MKKTTKLAILLLLILPTLTFIGCSNDDNDKTITNLSGIDWYNTTIVFVDTEGGEITDYKDAGTVKVGASCTISSEKTIFHILAKDASGNGIISKDIHLVGGKATVKEGDLK